jgi:eukaryotic-like serine/threonine-protein kinase
VSEGSSDRQAFEVSIAVSPDGSRFAGIIASPTTTYDIWISERGRPSSRRVVAVPGADAVSPVWSPDGTRIAYGQQSLSETNGIYVVSPSGSGSPQRITRAGPKSWLVPTSWSPDGTQILCKTILFGRRQIFVTPASPPGGAAVEPKPLFPGTARCGDGMFSPDGRCIAYESDESGKDEVYVTAWTAGGPDGEPLSVSVGGGSIPIWAPGGKRLYYLSPERKVMSVAITTSPRLTASAPSVAWDLEALGIVENLCDLLPDGRLLAIQKAEGEGEISRFDLTVNFFDELHERLAAAKK